MDINITSIMQYLAVFLAVIGVLAFIVAVITQVIKEMPGLVELPTSAVALVIALILCPVSLVAASQYYKIVITWYMIFASFIAAFIVYLIATGGWDAVNKIWQRTKYKKNGSDAQNL